MNKDLQQRRQSVVQTHMQFYKLILALGEKFGLDQVLEIVAKWRFEEGKQVGAKLKEEIGVTGDSAEDFLKIWQEHGKRVGIKAEVFKDEEGNIIFRHSGFCPCLTAIGKAGAPWEKICPTWGWPYIEGMLHAVNPDLKLVPPSELKWRTKGDRSCDHKLVLCD
ncbi:MAG: hypothetical protein QHH75_13110 [Bacillota bacterium]|jgi:hypothetical protein|nr:hypothetical protein [Bacillota bacterium]